MTFGATRVTMPGMRDDASTGKGTLARVARAGAVHAPGDAANDPALPRLAGRVLRRCSARRHHLPRALGHALAFVAIAPVLAESGASSTIWLLLALHCFGWPHLAWLVAARSDAPARLERRNLLIDAGGAGFWIAVMQFNLMPSAVLVAVLAMDRACAGGLRLALQAIATLALACAVAAVALGVGFAPATSVAGMLATLPFLLLYPTFVGNFAWTLGQQVREQNRLLEALSRTDGLSGLLNRSHWESVVAEEFARARRSARPLALVMLDVDHFKSINDRFGHPVGDEAIRRVAGLVRASIRASDVAGRYGGEEFCVLLPDTSLEDAHVVAERIRRTIESASIEAAGHAIRCTVSLGVAVADIGAPVADPQPWIERADRALYRAKAEGRNRTVLAA
jgi:diguanylate cyclase